MIDIITRRLAAIVRRLCGKKNQSYSEKSITSQETEAADQEEPLHVAIIGGGIGGLALAIGLIRKNVPFTLYEAAPAFSTVGAGIGLGPNALNAMDLIDKRLRSMYYDISSGNVTPNKENVMMDVLYAEEGFGEKRGFKAASFGAACYDRTSAHRKDLLDIMTSLIPADKVRFNKRVKNFRQKDNKVVINFEDGEVAEAAALIGCDGAKGPTRQVVLGSFYPEEVKPKYTGKYVYRSIVPMEDTTTLIGEHAGDAKSFIGHNINFITFPISRGTQYNIVAFKFDDKPWTHHQWTKEVSHEEMVGDFVGVDKRLVKLLDVSFSFHPSYILC